MNIVQNLVLAIVSCSLILFLGYSQSFAVDSNNVEIKPVDTIAQAGKKKAKKVKEKHIVREATASKANKTKIDFEAIDIAGERRVPLGTMITQNKADKNYDLIKIRLRWHPEMVQSTSSLETGRSK